MTQLRGLQIISGANILAMSCLLGLSIGLTGGKLVLYLCVSGLHLILGLAILRQQRWSFVVMIIYALLQAVGMSVWSLISVMTLLGESLSHEKMTFFLVAGIVVPFLIWTIGYLIKTLKHDQT